MKNLMIFFVLFTFAASAQSIDVLAENSTVEFSGGTYYVNSSSGQDVDLYLVVRNNTGTDQNWDLERVLPPMPHWDDWSMSWAPYSNPLNGNDFIIDPIPNWVTQLDIAIPQDDSMYLALRYEPLSDGCDLFKYYIHHDDVRVDSFNIQMCKTVSLDELLIENVLIYPNPCNSSLNVEFKEDTPREVIVFDLLGNKIANIEVFSSAEIPASDFSDGMYFLYWTHKGVIRKKKFQVQH